MRQEGEVVVMEQHGGLATDTITTGSAPVALTSEEDAEVNVQGECCSVLERSS